MDYVIYDRLNMEVRGGIWDSLDIAKKESQKYKGSEILVFKDEVKTQKFLLRLINLEQWCLNHN